MINHKLVKRIVTCQGSIQLVTALSVLNYREKQQQELNIEYENFLVIYDLYTPPEQIEEFAKFIKKMAQLVIQWKAIIYINPQQLDSISNKLANSGSSKIYDLVNKLVGTQSADEIYLCRNWQFGNQLLINTYKSAEKICYGDSIGIYFSSNAKGFFTASTPAKLHLSSYIKNKIQAFISKVKENLQLKTVLKFVDFDIGYFTLPNILGESPPMKTIILDKLELLTTFDKLRGLIDINYILQLKDKIADNHILILLTSNLSEAERMSEENEINAYHKFLIAQDIKPDTILIIKPHPRDGNTKIKKLQSKLVGLFSNILVLSEPYLFFLPFEILFAQLFLKPNMSVRDNIRVLTVSSACISLKLLFNVPCIIGFGDQITTKEFYENYIRGRLEHERDLRAAIKNIEFSETIAIG